MQSSRLVGGPLVALALLVGACGGDGSTDGMDVAAPEPTTAPPAETTAEAADCALNAEEATELAGMRIDVVESRSAGVEECRYFQGTSENSAPKFRYRFRRGTLQDKDGEPLTVATSEARYNSTTGTLLVQVDEGELLDVKGYALQQQNLVGIGEAIVSAQ